MTGPKESCQMVSQSPQGDSSVLYVSTPVGTGRYFFQLTVIMLFILCLLRRVAYCRQCGRKSYNNWVFNISLSNAVIYDHPCPRNSSPMATFLMRLDFQFSNSHRKTNVNHAAYIKLQSRTIPFPTCIEL